VAASRSVRFVFHLLVAADELPGLDERRLGLVELALVKV